MNARVGCKADEWLDIIGARGAKNCDNNGELEQRLFFAGDSAIVAQAAEKIQVSVDRFEGAASVLR